MLEPGSVPPSLKQGDLIRIISPAGPIRMHSLDHSIELLRDNGFKVDTGKHVYDEDEYLAGSDESRLMDLLDALYDDSVKSVICSRGGYGTQRLLASIPWNDLKKMPPKLLIGFSDIGSLQVSLLTKAGWSSVSGLLAANGLSEVVDKASVVEFINSLTKGFSGELISPTDPNNLVKLSGNIAGSGVLIPICLTVLVSLLGTPYFPDLDGVILCLEDVGEAPYRIDRLFWQLFSSGRCEDLRGVILGAFLHDGKDISTYAAKSAGYWLHRRNIPLWQDMPYGHFQNRVTLPFGRQIEISIDGKLTFE